MNVSDPLKFTFGIESTDPNLVGQLLDQTQRLNEINRAIKAADEQEIKLKKIKKT